eukprot:sb/3478121/
MTVSLSRPKNSAESVMETRSSGSSRVRVSLTPSRTSFFVRMATPPPRQLFLTLQIQSKPAITGSFLVSWRRIKSQLLKRDRHSWSLGKSTQARARLKSCPLIG